MRFRGVPVITNTPPRGAQRGPGQNQIAAAIEPLIDKAARQLGSIASRFAASTRPTTPRSSARSRAASRARISAKRSIAAPSCSTGRARSAQRPAHGSKVRGVGVGTAYHAAGRNGFDGLVRITPDGKLHIHSGVGNLGTYSYTATSRVAAEVLKANWDNCIVVRGDSSKDLPW